MHMFYDNAQCLECKEVPTTLNKAMVYLHSNMIILTSHGPIDASLSDSGQLPNQIFWNMWKCEYTLDGGQAEALWVDILNGMAVVVSNGLFQLGNGAATWTIEGAMAQHHIKGAGQTPGNANDQSTYWL